MKIVVDTRVLQKDCQEGYSYFLCEVLKRVVKKYSDHEFIFVFDRSYDAEFLFNKNVTAVVTGPGVNNPLLWKLWYDVKIPALLRKHNADIFVSTDGICSLTAKTPQCVIVHDLSFLNYPSFIKKTDLFFYKRYFKKFLQKANSIITVSEFLKAIVSDQYAVKEEKVIVVHGAAKEIFSPLNENRKEEIKNKYTGGKNYFIYAGDIHPQKNLINLLKAFSGFKKRQKSNWKLVLTGKLDKNYKSFGESIKTYKYRDEVVILTGQLEEKEKAGLLGSAYAFIYPSLKEGFGLAVLEAMNCHVPVLTSPHSAMQEIARDAALYADPADHKDIADKMMLLYKDESLRNGLIEKGKLIAAQYSWDKTVDLFWQSILKAIK